MILRRENPDALGLRGAVAATAALSLLAVALTGGCGPKEAATTPASKGQAPVAGAPASEVKLTPEQEAVRQRAIQQGAAIEAAQRRSQGQ